MNTSVKFYGKLMLYRLPWMAALFLLCAGIGLALAIKLPTTYTTDAKLLVEPPQIADVGPDDTTDGAELLEVIQQRLMTRGNLIDIANKYRVAGAGEQSADQIVEEMRDKTNIERIAGRNRATLMVIAFTAEDPRSAASVVNEYVTLILQENVRLRTNRAEDNLSFFEQEVERLSRQLNEQSSRIVDFQTKNADALPDSLDYRLNRQALLQERLARAERDIAGFERQRAEILRVYETTGRLQAPREQRQSPEEARLEKLRNELTAALTVYSESNPKIRNLKAQLAQQESLVAAQIGAGGGAGDDDSRQESLLNITMAQIDSNIASLKSESEEISFELDDLEQSISETPSNGVALDALERDLNNLQNQYNDAVSRLNQARMSERIEVTSKGQRITVIEQAAVPNEPTSPNRPMIAGLGIGAGLAAALGLFVLLEVLNSTLRRPVELRNRLGVSPLATIPYMESVGHRRMRRALLVGSLAIVVIGVPMALWAIDQYYLPLDLIIDRAIDRLGLG